MTLSVQIQSDVINVQTLRSNFGDGLFEERRDVDRMVGYQLQGWFVSNTPTQSLSDANGWGLQVALRAKNVLPLIGAWRRHVLNVKAPVDFERISETFDGVFQLIEIGGSEYLNMNGLDAEIVNAAHLVTALRASFRWRSQIAGWGEAVVVARHALMLANAEDIDRCLSGLEN